MQPTSPEAIQSQGDAISLVEPGERDPRGQVLVIVAMGLVALIAMVGLVIDGGYAWSQQRETQNGADAVAKAGTVVVQHAYAQTETPTDGDVGCAVEDSAAVNGVDLVKAIYTNSEGTPLVPELEVGACDAGGVIPTTLGAQGVQATTSQEFDTFLAQVVGFDTFTTTADATAVVAPQVGLCPAASGCGVLPVTFPLSTVYCDGTNSQVSFGEGEWEIIDEADADETNLAIIPLCSTTAGTEAPGSVGWLDFGCGNLAETIANPCQVYVPIPGWVKTQTGNVNSVEDELNEYGGNQPGVAETDTEASPDADADEIMPLPIHNNSCETDLDGPNNDPALYQPPSACPEGDWSGGGSNLYYHIPYWVGFKVDQVYVQGSNVAECNSPPGYPSGVAGSGATSCLKGWFVERYDAPGAMDTRDLTPGELTPMGILLVE
jgi:hypothetical protein